VPVESGGGASIGFAKKSGFADGLVLDSRKKKRGNKQLSISSRQRS
jgi:hypothetical protein